LGVLRVCIGAIVASTLLFFVGFASPAQARSIALAQFTCSGGAVSAEAAFGLEARDLACDEGRFEARDPFLRARIDLTRTPMLPPGRLIWQTDPTNFDSMLIRLTYADGRQRLIDVDAQMAVRNWDANGNFWVPVQQGAAPLTTIDVVVERPQSRAIFTRMTLTGFEDALRSNYGRTLLYVLICGILLVPIVYDVFFFRVLRARFMVWHLAMTVGTLGYVLFNSGLILLPFPEMPNLFRFAMIFIVTSAIMLSTARFSLLILEEGSVSKRAGQMLAWLPFIPLALSFLILLDLEALRMRLIDIYLLGMLPVIGVTILVQATAIFRRSRAAVFLVVASSGLFVAGTAQILAGLGLFDVSDLIDEAIYASLVLLVAGTSAVVCDRFLIIKAQRDRARVNARQPGRMAHTDGLTGLLNRRAFDQHRRLPIGQALLLADLDRFKQINDTFGHQRGDAVLCRAGAAIKDAVPSLRGASVYRLGGEEFAVLAPASCVEEVGAVCETVRLAVEQASFEESAFDHPQATVSVGAVMGSGQLMHVAFSDADEALYAAKQGGRNRCHLAEH